jgi:hypothetical protein
MQDIYQPFVPLVAEAPHIHIVLLLGKEELLLGLLCPFLEDLVKRHNLPLLGG